MHSNPLIAACLAAALMAAGCSEEYGHDRLDAQSPEFRAVRAMLDTLRDAGGTLDDVIDAQLPDDMDAPQAKGMRWILTKLAQANQAELLRMDRWGAGWYRATITYDDQDGQHTTAILLTPDDDDAFYWIKAN